MLFTLTPALSLKGEGGWIASPATSWVHFVSRFAGALVYALKGEGLDCFASHFVDSRFRGNDG